MGQYKGIMGGIDTMVASRFTPWHYSYNQDRVKLTDLEIRSGRQGLVMAGCDWSVLKLSLGEFMPGYENADEHSVLIRNDRPLVLGKAGKDYTVIPNDAVADLSDAVIEAVEGACIESMGALFDGKVVWSLVRLPEGKVFGTDGAERHERYVLISTTHNGQGSLTVRHTDVRVECMNTISMAWNGSEAEVSIRHTTNALDYVDEARRALTTIGKNRDAMDAEIQRLLDMPLDSTDFAVDFLPTIIGERPKDEGRGQTMYDAKFDSIIAAYEADHNEAIVDTAWGAVNAVNEHEVWAIKPRGRELWEAQFARVLSGNFDMTRQALRLLSA